MYPPGYLYDVGGVRERELERKAERRRLLVEIGAVESGRPAPLRAFLLHLGRLLETSGTRLQRAAGYAAERAPAGR